MYLYEAIWQVIKKAGSQVHLFKCSIKFSVDNAKWNYDITSILKVISHFKNSEENCVDNETNECIVNQCHFTPLSDNLLYPVLILCHYCRFYIITSSGLKMF